MRSHCLPTCNVGAVLLMQAEVEEGRKLLAAWDGELHQLAGRAGQTEGSSAEMGLQERMAAKEEEVSIP